MEGVPELLDEELGDCVADELWLGEPLWDPEAVWDRVLDLLGAWVEERLRVWLWLGDEDPLCVCDSLGVCVSDWLGVEEELAVSDALAVDDCEAVADCVCEQDARIAVTRRAGYDAIGAHEEPLVIESRLA